MQRFWNRATAGAKTIPKMVFLDCRVDLFFIFVAMGVAFLATHVSGFIMSAIGVEQDSRIDIAYLVPILTLSSVLGVFAIRSRLALRQSPIARSTMVAVAIGLGLLASRSAWNGFNPTTFNPTVAGILLLITVCFIAPLLEELFFRGYLWNKLSARGYGAGLIAIATSLLYVLPHVPNSFAAFADYATIGLFLGAVRYFSGRLLLPVLFHTAMNSMLIFNL